AALVVLAHGAAVDLGPGAEPDVDGGEELRELGDLGERPEVGYAGDELVTRRGARHGGPPSRSRPFATLVPRVGGGQPTERGHPAPQGDHEGAGDEHVVVPGAPLGPDRLGQLLDGGLAAGRGVTHGGRGAGGG